jgi:hypothetical protein
MYLLPKQGYAGILEADYWEAVWVSLGSGSSKTSKDSLLVTNSSMDLTRNIDQGQHGASSPTQRSRPCGDVLDQVSAPGSCIELMEGFCSERDNNAIELVTNVTHTLFSVM